MDDDKIEASLQLATQLSDEERAKSEELSTGFHPMMDSWEVILRITGEVEELQRQIPDAFFRPLSGGYVIGLVPQTQLSALAELPQVIYIEQPKRIETQVAEGIRASCIWPLQREIAPTGNLTGRGVFVGIIDSGIDYFHPDFRNEDGTTRIAWLWDDGEEYSREQINTALSQPTRQEAYRVVPMRDASGHGTHVAGIAAGNGRASEGVYRGIAYESELLVAKLGNARPGGFPKTTQLMEAVEAMKTKATELGKPVAINISFGNQYGSHAGTSLLETYLAQVSNQWKMSIAVGMGNDGDRALHQEGRLQSGETEEVAFGIGDVETGINLQIWKNYLDAMDITLVAPDGREVLTIGADDASSAEQNLIRRQWQNTTLYAFLGTPTPYSVFQEIYVSFLPKTNYLDGGIWKVQLRGKQIKDGKYSMWIPTGGILGERTGFLNPSTETTISVPATAEGIIAVGAYDSRGEQYASFSGRGNTWETDRLKPDLVAPGVDITSAAPGGGYQTRSGTSMATPFVTGTAALIMQWGIVDGNDPFAYGEKLRAYLQKGAVPLRQQELPSIQTGWGALCANQSIPRTRIL